MSKARKYILNISDIISCGIGTYTGTTIQHNILDSFTISQNNITCTYPSISIYDLQSLSVGNYNQRVIDYINTLEIETEITKETLYNQSTFDNNDCFLICELNPDFIVYKFLTGVRIINIGEVSGIAQYKLYPLTGDSNNFSWQISPTFLDLNQNDVYVAEIRDFYNNNELCKYSKTFSLPLLLGSTTLTLVDKTISLNQNLYINQPNLQTKSGVIQINPNLSTGEKVTLFFNANLNVFGDANASINFTCKPNNSSNFVNYCNLTTNTIKNINGVLELLYGDTICYNVSVNNNNYGTNALANFSILNANGYGIINPIIDINNCSSSVNSCLESLNIQVSLTGNTIVSETSDLLTIKGLLGFSNPIPQGQCINIHLKNLNSVNSSNTSITTFYRKKITDSNYLQYHISNNYCSQPDTPIISAEYGDSFCYNISLTTMNYGQISSASICINNLVGSVGVNPIINPNISGNSLSYTKIIAPLNKVIAVCRVGEIISDENKKTCGVINITPALSINQSISVNYCIDLVSAGLGYNKKVVQIYCRFAGSGGYVLKNEYMTEIDGSVCNYSSCRTTGNFNLNYGDEICYTNCSVSICPLQLPMNGNGSAFIINSVSNGISIHPTICSLSGKDRDVLIG